MVDYKLLPGSLDLFELMVNYVAGGIFLSFFVWAGILLVTGIMGRLSMESLLIIIITFMIVAFMGYFNGLVAVGIFLLCALYMTINIINWWQSMR